MKNKNDVKLDVLDKLDDNIVNRATDKRNKLMGKKRLPKWIIPSSAAAVVVLAMMIPLFMLLFVKQVPIYTGMSVSDKNPTSMAAEYKPKYSLGLLANMDNNGNHNGQDNGNGNKKPVKDIVEDTLSVTGTGEEIYYAKPQQDIYITLHIENPDNFVILSFTLNGKVYSSYMFEEGSDMENIVLKYNVGNAQGIVEYTVDAIKYVDGNEIKDVIMEGDRTVKVGVYSEGIQPTASITNELVGINEISFKANLSDEYELISRSGGKAYAILFGEDNIIARKELTVGENEITFDGLETSASYRYGIVAYYDSLDGSGMTAHVMLENEFTTQSVVAIGGVNVDQTSIDFSVIFNEAFESKALSSMVLYHGEEKVKEFDVSGDITQSTFSAIELLSNNTYKLVLTYENLGETETVEFPLTTEAKATPEVTITENSKTQTSIKFDVAVTDVDAVGDITKIDIIHGEDVQNITDLATREFADLLSNNDYTVKVTYTYDLNDGVGDQIIEKTLDVKTEAKATPDLEITETGKSQTSFKFDIAITDIDAVGAITKIELIHGEDVTNVEDLTARELTDLLSNNDYTVKVTYTYDLGDGVGEQIIEKSINFKTIERVEPTFTIKDITSDTYTVSGSYEQTDADNTLISYTVNIYKGDELIKENADKEIAFDSLDYYTDYSVKIIYTFDVNDGVGVQTKTVKQEIKTHPYIDATSMSVRSTGVVFEGDKVYLQGSLNNPCGVTVKTVVINGNEYEVRAASTANVLLVEIENNGQFASGNVTLTLEGFSFTLGGVDYTAASETRCSDTAKMVTQAEIVSVECVDAGLNYSAWAPKAASKEEYKRFLLVTLNGDQFGEIKNILLRIDANDVFNEFELTPQEVQNLGGGRFLITIPDLTDNMLTDPWGESTVTLVCGNDYLDSYTVSKKAGEFTIIDRFMTVSTVEEFVSLNEYPYQPIYVELTADLDLSDAENFYGLKRFVGVFDGKGHTITNFSVVGKSNDIWQGLFNCFDGELCNLTLDDSLYMVELTDDGSYGAYEYMAIGGLVGQFEGGEINNCTVGSGVIISASAAPSAPSIPLVGGIVGYSQSNVNIVDCENYASVSAVGADCVGGIMGYGDHFVYISNCTNSGNVSATAGTAYAGGIAGICYTVSNCTNNGEISSDNVAGGIVGFALYGTITDCINSGEISSNNVAGGIAASIQDTTITNCINSGEAAAGIVVQTYGECEITNCHSLYALGGATYGESCTVDQLNSKEFYTETLGWSEDIWDFSDLDIENGKYPKLK